MKVESKNVAPCRVKLSIRADAAEIHGDYEDVVRRYVREAPVHGFRRGKAPRAIIEREYHNELDRDIRQRLVSRFAGDAVREAKVSVVEMVGVENLLFSQETGLTFDLLCDVAPDFKLPKYQSIPVKLVEPAVTDGDVENHIRDLRRRFGSYNDGGADQAIEAGDVACVNFSATSGDKPLKEAAPGSDGMAEGIESWMNVSEPELIPGVSAALVGMKAGDEKSFKTRFPKDFRLQQLQGVKAEYNVKLVKFKRPVPAEESDLNKVLGVADGAGLRAQIGEMLLERAKREETERRRREVSDYLLKKCDFELPESEVGRETHATIRMMVEEAMRQGGNAADLTEHRDEMLASATSMAKSRLRLSYILARIAGEVKIETTDEEVNAEIRRLAATTQRSEKELRDYFEKNYALEQLRIDLRNRKTMDFLVDSLK